MNDFSPSILIVDDDQDHLALVARYVDDAGYQCAVAEDGLKAIDLIKAENFSIIITDMVMPTLDGMQIIKFVKGYAPLTNVIVMTGYSKNYSYIDVIKAGASDFIEKPFPQDELIAKFSRILREKSIFEKLRREIDSHKKTSSALLIAKNTAEKANEIKSSFINTISHEFLTPMNGIMGFSEILAGTELDSRQKEFLEMIQKSSDRLMLLINQLLDFSRLESRQKNKKPHFFSLKQVLESVLTAFQEKAKNKGIALELLINETVPTDLSGDPEILKRLLHDLTDNALKFTEHGRIQIKVQIQEIQPDNFILLHFSVKDSGCGIPTDKQETIFEAFTQAENYLTRSHEGAGLGLAVCKKLAKQLGGDIWLTSKIHKGSSFHFTAKFLVP